MKYLNQINFGLVLVAAAVVVYAFSLTFWNSDTAPIRVEMATGETAPPDSGGAGRAEPVSAEPGSSAEAGGPSAAAPRLFRNRPMSQELTEGPSDDPGEEFSGADNPDPGGFVGAGEQSLQEGQPTGTVGFPSRARPVTRRPQPLQVGDPARFNNRRSGSLVTQQPPNPEASGDTPEPSPDQGQPPENPPVVEPAEPPPSAPPERRQSPPPPPTRSSMP